MCIHTSFFVKKLLNCDVPLSGLHTVFGHLYNNVCVICDVASDLVCIGNRLAMNISASILYAKISHFVNRTVDIGNNCCEIYSENRFFIFKLFKCFGQYQTMAPIPRPFVEKDARNVPDLRAVMKEKSK